MRCSSEKMEELHVAIQSERRCGREVRFSKKKKSWWLEITPSPSDQLSWWITTVSLVGWHCSMSRVQDRTCESELVGDTHRCVFRKTPNRTPFMWLLLAKLVTTWRPDIIDLCKCDHTHFLTHLRSLWCVYVSGICYFLFTKNVVRSYLLFTTNVRNEWYWWIPESVWKK